MDIGLAFVEMFFFVETWVSCFFNTWSFITGLLREALLYIPICAILCFQV